MKKVVVQPFLTFKASDNLLSNIDKQTDKKTQPKQIIKDSKKRINQKGANSFIALDPQSGEGFSFIPLIHDGSFFAAKFPNPIHLYYHTAYDAFCESENLFKNITFKTNPEDSLLFIEEDLFYTYIAKKVSSIIFLHSTLEAFFNNFIPDEFTYSTKRNNTDLLLNKHQIIREISIKEKFLSLLPLIFGIDFKANHKKIYDNILGLINTRNELIHLKIVKLKNNLHYHGEVENIVNLKIDGYIDSIFQLIHIIKPGFLELKELSKNYFEFNFSKFTAFKTDISIFLEILKSKSKLISINIPHAEEKSFYQMKDWIMQNLEIMRSNKLLMIGESSYKKNGDLLICIEKLETGFI